MANFDSGCKGFVVMECAVRVNFPIDWKDRAEIACKHCPYLSSNERMCQLSKQPVQNPKQYVGIDCPLKFNENEENENESN